MAKDEKNKIIKTGTSALSKVPDYLTKAEGQKPAGLENIDRGDMTLPRLGLCQSMSHERKKQDPKYIKDLEEGQYFNTVTQEIYGSRVLIVPLHFFKNRMRFEAEGKGILCRSDDSVVGVGDPGGDCIKCPMSQFIDGERPECSFFYNYASICLPEGRMPRFEDLIVVSLKSTGLKVARDWNARMRLRNLDSFAGIYEFTASEQKNTQGSWFQPVIKPHDLVTEQVYNVAKAMYLSVRDVQQKGGLKVDLEREPGDENSPAEM